MSGSRITYAICYCSLFILFMLLLKFSLRLIQRLSNIASCRIHHKIRTINDQEGTEHLIGITTRSSKSLDVNLAVSTGLYSYHLDVCTRTGNGHIYLGALHILAELSPLIIIGWITFIIPLSRGIRTTPAKCIATDNKIL